MWINGLAGTGKSTLAQTIARWCDKSQCLGSSFFCARSGDRNNVRLIFPTIAQQLASSNESFLDGVKDTVRKNSDIHFSHPSHQLEKLIVEPLRALRSSGVSLPSWVIVIDALDECEDVEAVSVILSSLSQFLDDLHPLRFIVTSRPLEHIVKGFRYAGLRDRTHSLLLGELPQDMIQRDITTYLRASLAAVRDNYYLADVWPGSEKTQRLVDLASGLFIFAATAVKYIDDRSVDDPETQLEAIIHATTAVLPDGAASPFAFLDALYLQVLRSSIPKNMSRERLATLKVVVGAIILMRDRLSPMALDALLYVKPGTTRRVLTHLGAIISSPATERGTITIIHPSFPEFLVDPSRCVQSEFVVRPQLHHTMLAKYCLQTLNQALRHNPCDLQDTSVLNCQITDLACLVARSLSTHLQYVARYWAYHLCNASVDEELLNLLERFCKAHLLHWLELLSLIGDVDAAVDALRSSQIKLKVI